MGWPIFAALGAAAGNSTMSGLGSIFSMDQDRKLFHENQDWSERLQKEFAQHGIEWRVADAKRAGLHPLAALGASGANFTPLTPDFPRNKMGEAVNKMGQQIQGGIDRAIEIEGKKANTELMESQTGYYRALASKVKKEMEVTTNGKVTPYDPFAPLSSNDVGDVDWRNSQRTKHGIPGVESGLTAAKQVVMNEDGVVDFALTQNVSEGYENDWANQFKLAYRGIAKQIKSIGVPTPLQLDWLERERDKLNKIQPLPKGYEYRFSVADLGFKVAKIGPEGSKIYSKGFWRLQRNVIDWILDKIDKVVPK